MSEYLDVRVKQQREWYEKKANENKKKFISYQTIIIVFGALIPVIVALESVSTLLKEWGGPITAIISAMIAIYAGLDKLKQPQPNWFNYRANEEIIKKEEWFYKYKAGPYKSLSDEDADILIVERIEDIISVDIARTTRIKEKEEVENGRVESRPAVATTTGT
jgi:hypothetical protein